MNQRQLSLTLFLAIVAVAAHAEVYRWVDAQGKVQYSDQPPPDVNAKKMTTKPAAPVQPTATTKSYQEQEQDFRKRRVEQEEQAKKLAESDRQAKVKQDNCIQSRGRLASLQAGGRFAKINEKGEREYLDDRGTSDAIAEAQKAVSDWCK